MTNFIFNYMIKPIGFLIACFGIVSIAIGLVFAAVMFIFVLLAFSLENIVKGNYYLGWGGMLVWSIGCGNASIMIFKSTGD